MNKLSWIIALCATFLLASCDPGPQQLLDGKWAAKNDNDEFTLVFDTKQSIFWLHTNGEEIGKFSFKIKKISDNRLILTDNSAPSNSDGIDILFIDQNTFEEGHGLVNSLIYKRVKE